MLTLVGEKGKGGGGEKNDIIIRRGGLVSVPESTLTQNMARRYRSGHA